MKQDYFKELIKLETEWLRMYFILLLADASGSAAILVRIFRGSNLPFEWILFFIGFVVAFILFLLILKTNSRIKKFISPLNN